jgi:S2P endopeptidase
MHYPYAAFLRSSGLSVKFGRIQWQFTVCNRLIIKNGKQYSKFLKTSFKLGSVLVVALLPLATGLLVYSALSTEHSTNGQMSNDKNPDETIHFALLLPGVNLPLDEIGYYVLTLAICSFVHEIGHAVCASLSEVTIRGLGFHLLLVLPIAYTEIDSDQLNSLRLWHKLRILCAGIWHNLILAGLSYLLLGGLPYLFVSVYRTNSSIIITDMKWHSPLMGSKGLHIGDEITTINNCRTRNIEEWYNCLSLSIRVQPSYCVTNDFLHQNDESVPIFHDDTGLVECCDIKNTKANCFESVLTKEDDIIELPQFLCLQIRKVIESADGYCNTPTSILRCHDEVKRHCFKPILNNSTTILHILREGKKDVVYIGHPQDLTNTITVSEFIPKTSIFSSWMADSILLLLKYITVFSLGLAYVNIIPCFGFDGQHISNAILDSLPAPDKPKREVIALFVNVLGKFQELTIS